MSQVSEWIVREYFETLGFLATQPRKYAVAARPKQAGEEVDLIVVNPAVDAHRIPEHVLWTSADLAGISGAVVGVRGWHTDRFTPAVLQASPEIFRFAEPDAVQDAALAVGDQPLAKIICLPALAASADTQAQTLALLRERGIDGVLLFPDMLTELVSFVDVNRNYEKSDVLQLLRILKNYDLLKDRQLELFRSTKKAKAT